MPLMKNFLILIPMYLKAPIDLVKKKVEVLEF